MNFYEVFCEVLEVGIKESKAHYDYLLTDYNPTNWFKKSNWFFNSIFKEVRWQSFRPNRLYCNNRVSRIRNYEVNLIISNLQRVCTFSIC